MTYQLKVYDGSSEYLADDAHCVVFGGLELEELKKIMDVCLEHGKYFTVSATYPDEPF